MFNMSSESQLRGPGYIILNVIRVLNIISLLTVVVASWVMLVMTVKTSNFFFFDGVSHFITSSIGLFLIVSELSLFESYFTKYWPLLCVDSGFVFLGIAMIVSGFNILGNLNKGATSVSSLGLPLWRIVIAAGFLSSLMGFFNIIATFVFCDSKNGFSARQVRSHGAAISKPIISQPYSLSSGSTRRAATSVLPSYHTDTEGGSKATELRSSPVAPNVQRPATALHPYHATSPQQPGSWRDTVSRYSVASQVTRF